MMDLGSRYDSNGLSCAHGEIQIKEKFQEGTGKVDRVALVRSAVGHSQFRHWGVTGAGLEVTGVLSARRGGVWSRARRVIEDGSKGGQNDSDRALWWP